MHPLDLKADRVKQIAKHLTTIANAMGLTYTHHQPADADFPAFWWEQIIYLETVMEVRDLVEVERLLRGLAATAAIALKQGPARPVRLQSRTQPIEAA